MGPFLEGFVRGLVRSDWLAGPVREIFKREKDGIEELLAPARNGALFFTH